MKYRETLPVEKISADSLQAVQPRCTSGNSRNLFGLLIIAGFGLLVLGCGSGGSSGSGNGNGGNGGNGGNLTTINETTDCTADPDTTCDAMIDSVFTGDIADAEDIDWLRVNLVKDTTYSITSDDSDVEISLRDPMGDAADPDIGDDKLYTPPSDGNYYIAVSLDPRGSYMVTISQSLGVGRCDTADNEGDCDKDMEANDVDVDDNNNGLIEIATDVQLNNVRHVLNGGGYKGSASATADTTGCPPTGVGCIGYELTTSLDLSDIDGDGTASDFQNWQPIGVDDSSPFTTIFEGNGNAITGINSSGTYTNFGFFGFVGSGGTVRNLHVAGTISATGPATGERAVGGLAGQNHGNISGCSAAVTITRSNSNDTDVIGGLVGISTGTIFNSWSSRPVTAQAGIGTLDRIGGLVGEIRGSVVRNSWSSATVTGSNTSTQIGGLVGLVSVDSSEISDSYAIGNVTGGSANEFVGGLVGTLSSNNSVSNSYATGNVNGGAGDSDIVGGLIGRADGTVTNSFYSGTVMTEGSEMAASVDGVTMKDREELMTPTSAAMASSAVGTTYRGWNSNSWDFGTASHFPALKSYKLDGGGTQQIAGDLLCGQPGPRATRTECTATTLVP